MKRLTAYGLRLVTLCFCVSVVSSVEAQEPPLWPGAKYDPAIPTIQQVIGHEQGEVITPPEQVARTTCRRCRRRRPTRTRLIEYARTLGGPAAVAVRRSAAPIASPASTR